MKNSLRPITEHCSFHGLELWTNLQFNQSLYLKKVAVPNVQLPNLYQCEDVAIIFMRPTPTQQQKQQQHVASFCRAGARLEMRANGAVISDKG